MTMDLEYLKEAYKEKSQADLKDIDLVLKAVPFLVREVIRLEERLSKTEQAIEYLNRRRPPSTCSGSSKDARWKASVDRKENRLTFKLSGSFDYRSSKAASNKIVSFVSELKPGFDVICDLSELNTIKEKRLIFHIRKIVFILNQSGVSRVVRIFGTHSKQFRELLKNCYGGAGREVAIYEAANMEEALHTLENERKFLKP